MEHMAGRMIEAALVEVWDSATGECRNDFQEARNLKE